VTAETTRGSTSASWAVPLIVVSLGIGLLGGYVRWGRAFGRAETRLEVLHQLARPPAVTALKDARPAAVIDLTSPEGTSLVKGQWRYVRKQGASSYRIDVTIPEQIGDFEARASAVLFEVAVDGYAEVWVNGSLSPVLGQNGGSLIAGYNARNRVVLTRDARPGQRIELALVGVERLLSEPPADVFSIRSATLDFIPPAPENPRGVGEIVRLDPALDAIVSPGARIQKVADGLRSVEGPLWMPQGFLLFSDFSANLIYRWTPDDGLSVFRTKSGYAGFDLAKYALPGSNGLAVDREGRLTVAEHGRRRVVRLERNGAVTVLADAYEGRRLNSPNDLVYKSDGALYFTDPPFGLPMGRAEPRRELPYSGVFRWFGGRLQLLTADLAGPNGLAFSPDERHLYLADWDKRAVVRYDVNGDGTLASGRIFLQMGVDGIKVDERGNVYVAGQGGVWIISPEGKPLGTIKPPERPSNLAWGDDDRRSLYLTAGTGIYRIRVEVSGAAALSGPRTR
jgi:gluconolactonase